MSNSAAIDRVDRLATKLHARPLAVQGYKLLKFVENPSLTLRHLSYRLRSGAYPVEAETARARFRVPTRQEFLDLDRVEERPILENLIGELRPDDVFYDVGANIGLYSCLAADEVETEVVAFEPHPLNADRLEENVELNDASVSVYRRALSASSGTAELALAPDFPLEKLGSAGHTILEDYFDEEAAESESVRVSKQRGDRLVAEEDLAPPTVVKIDVEGTEMDALSGLESALSRPECRLVYCEVHDERLRSQGHSASELRTFLEERGFVVEDRSIRDGQPFFRAEKDGPDR
jgi:FkbM family methyltransferase